MPATLTIKSTRTGGKAIDYSSAHNGKDKAHNHNNFDRVLAASGVNCTPETGKALMQAVWRKKRTKERNMIEAYTVVQSFDPKNFDFRNKEDIELANKMGQELVQKVVPTRLALVYTQADGTHNVIHNHIIVCSIDDVTLKAMRGDQKQFKTWANANDRVLREHGYETLKGITSHYAKSKEKITRAEIGASESKIIKDIYGNEMVQTGTVTRTEKIKERIESLMSDPSVNSWDSFQEKAKDADLDVKIRYNKKTHEVNGLSYRLLDDPSMRRGIRAKRLGSNYMKENLNDVFRQNLERFNEQKVERDKARQRELEQRKLEADRRQQNIERREEVTRRKVRQHLLPDGDDERISIT
ncbi:relaxase/mobilization nuclease domain-containing protein, partial [uncultured Lactobacillus sp.]|uniref:relaxase/mobilization nuclease domain-containing protein n=1 Tax=uncultured Lactobacillus sp. TaxID=153152 RepID=UPI0025984E14